LPKLGGCTDPAQIPGTFQGPSETPARQGRLEVWITMVTKRRTILVLALAAAGALCGCSTTSAVRVKPWERQYLADATMDPDRDALGTAMLDHVYFSREAASGGRGVGGAGCGCN
jgi:hypothetical protein